MSVSPVPAGYHSVTPYLICRNAAAAIDFYKAAFGAIEVMRMPGPDNRVMHAEITIGDSHVMLGDEVPDAGFNSPQHWGGTAVSLLVYVEQVDEVFARAISAGATQVRSVADQFYGDRSGILTDPFGHVWNVATHIEDLTPEQMAKRAATAFSGGECS